MTWVRNEIYIEMGERDRIYKAMGEKDGIQTAMVERNWVNTAIVEREMGYTEQSVRDGICRAMFERWDIQSCVR